jgi:hypothetical protein
VNRRVPVLTFKHGLNFAYLELIYAARWHCKPPLWLDSKRAPATEVASLPSERSTSHALTSLTISAWPEQGSWRSS